MTQEIKLDSNYKLIWNDDEKSLSLYFLKSNGKQIIMCYTTEVKGFPIESTSTLLTHAKNLSKLMEQYKTTSNNQSNVALRLFLEQEIEDRVSKVLGTDKMLVLDKICNENELIRSIVFEEPEKIDIVDIGKMKELSGYDDINIEDYSSRSNK